MHDDTIELRQPADETDALKAYLKPIAIAFGDTYDDAEFEADRPVWEIDRTIGAVEGDTWVGGGGAYSFRLTVPGRRDVRAAGITGVGVSPTHRRRGILTKVMRWLLDQAAERGEPVSILHASEGADLPALRVRSGDAPGLVRHRPERLPVPDAGRAIGSRPDRRSRGGARYLSGRSSIN